MDPRWQIFRKRYIPAIVPIIDYFSGEVGKKLNIKRDLTVNIWDKGWYSAIWEKRSKEELAHYALKYLLVNINQKDKIRKEGIKSGIAVVRHCQRFAARVKNKKIENFILFYEQLKKLYNLFIEKSMVYWLFTGELLEEKIKPYLTHYSEKEASEIFGLMSTPTILSYSQIEEHHFEKLMKIAKKYGVNGIKTKSAIETFSKKYFWFPYEYVGPDIWDVETVTKRVQQSLKKEDTRKQDPDLSKKQKACIKQFSLPPKLIHLFEILQLVTLMQDDRKKCNTQACYYINGVIAKSLAQKLGTDNEKIKYVETSLLRQFLKDKNRASLHKELAARMNLFIFLNYDHGSTFYSGNEAKEQLRKLGITLEVESSGVIEIKGKVTNKGVARGRARILLTSSGITDFQKGDILVTPMTTPDFVPLMSRAAALVTDEGGITSHAAVMSREFGIPCIVGTNNATTVFKDGDLIEVDTNKGTVRLVKKK